MATPHSSTNKKQKGCLEVNKWVLGVLILNVILFIAYFIVFIFAINGTKDVLNLTRKMERTETQLLDLTRELSTITREMNNYLTAALPKRESNKLMLAMGSTLSQFEHFPHVNEQFISILAMLNNITGNGGGDAGMTLLRIMEIIELFHSQSPEILLKANELLGDTSNITQILSLFLNNIFPDLLQQGQVILDNARNVTESARILITGVLNKKELDIKL